MICFESPLFEGLTLWVATGRGVASWLEATQDNLHPGSHAARVGYVSEQFKRRTLT